MEIEKYNEQKGRIEAWLNDIDDDSIAFSLLREQITIEPDNSDKARKNHITGLKTLLNMTGRTDLPSVTRSRGPFREAVYALNTEITEKAQALFDVAGDFMHKWETSEEYGEWFVKNIAESHHRHQKTQGDDKNNEKGA